MKGQSKEINYPIRPTNVQTDGTPSIDLDNRKQLYRTISEVIANIPVTNRNVGLTVTICNENGLAEYWWEKGIKDGDLVLKFNSKDIPNLQATVIDLQHQIDNVNNIEFKVFNSLPDVGNSSIIYVVPNPVGTDEDDYVEYFWINSEQRYERFGGLDASGGVTINNFYTFDENIFTVDEESDYKNVYLNSKKISIVDKGIKIYKLDIGEEDNEEFIYIQNYSRTIGNIVNRGGAIALNGKLIATGQTNKDYQTLLFYDRLEVSYEQGDDNYRAVLGASELYIENNIGGNIIELSNSNFKGISNKIFLQATGNNGFDINYNDLGVKGYVDNETDTLLLYNLDNAIRVTQNDIKLEIAGDSYIHLNYNTFNAVFDQLIYLNAPITKVKKVLFEQNSGSDIYLEPYHEIFSNVTYHGLKSESNIYIKDSNSYFIKSQTNYSLTSYGLNGIKHRDSNTSTDLGYNILNIGNFGALSLGKNNELTINNNEISLQKNNVNRFIKIDIDGNIILKRDGSEISITYDNEIELKGNNGAHFTIDSDGWCVMDGYQKSKIGLVGENNENSYFIIEKRENYILPYMAIRQNQNNFISLYKLDDEENCITIKSEYFRYMNYSNTPIFSIDSDNDIFFTPGNVFAIEPSGNFYKFRVDVTDGIHMGKSNQIDINNNNIYFKFGSKTITLDATGISDGTHTKTWNDIFSQINNN